MSLIHCFRLPLETLVEVEGKAEKIGGLISSDSGGGDEGAGVGA